MPPPGAPDGDGSSAVSVVVRVRPPLPHEIQFGHCTQACGRKVSLHAAAPADPRSAGQKQRRGQTFETEYDRVLDVPAQQADVWDAIRPTVEKSLEGYNVTVFAYGMTGSGKTYTMLGPELMALSRQESPPPTAAESQLLKHRGVVARAAQLLFDRLAQGDSTRVTMSYLQIYRERCYDLLIPAQQAEPLKVRDEGRNSAAVVVDGLTESAVTSVEECFQRLLYGFSNLAFRTTNYNEQSSRSHVVLTFNIQQVLGSGLVRSSKMHLVDLAGNERWDTLGPEMTRLHERELTAINKSLSVLGNCVQALSQAPSVSKKDGRIVAAHVPYRDSALTMLLRDSLGGNALTIMLCTVCGCSAYQMQTLQTLRFADRAKRMKMRAKVNDVSDAKGLLQQTQAEVTYLRTLVSEDTKELHQRLDKLAQENRALKHQLELESKEREATEEKLANLSTCMPQSRPGHEDLIVTIANGVGSVDAVGPHNRFRLRRVLSEPSLQLPDWWEYDGSAADADDSGDRSFGSCVGASTCRSSALEASPSPKVRLHSPRGGKSVDEFNYTELVSCVPHMSVGAGYPQAVQSPALCESSPVQASGECLAGRLEAENQALRARLGCHGAQVAPVPARPAAPGVPVARCEQGHPLQCMGTSAEPLGDIEYIDWYCDSEGCSNGSLHTPSMFRFHCAQCRYDLCQRCTDEMLDLQAEVPQSTNSDIRSVSCGGSSSSRRPACSQQQVPAAAAGTTSRGSVASGSSAPVYAQSSRPCPTSRGKPPMRPPRQMSQPSAPAPPPQQSRPTPPKAHPPRRRPAGQHSRSLSARRPPPTVSLADLQGQSHVMDYCRRRVQEAESDMPSAMSNPVNVPRYNGGGCAPTRGSSLQSAAELESVASSVSTAPESPVKLPTIAGAPFLKDASTIPVLPPSPQQSFCGTRRLPSVDAWHAHAAKASSPAPSVRRRASSRGASPRESPSEHVRQGDYSASLSMAPPPMAPAPPAMVSSSGSRPVGARLSPLSARSSSRNGRDSSDRDALEATRSAAAARELSALKKKFGLGSSLGSLIAMPTSSPVSLEPSISLSPPVELPAKAKQPPVASGSLIHGLLGQLDARHELELLEQQRVALPCG